MATFEEIKKQLEKAEKKLEKAEEKLEEWEEGEDDGKWLKELRRKSRRNDLSEKEEQEKARLEKKEEKLENDKEYWKEQVKEWGKALRELDKEKGNEQIHKKYFIYLFGILFTTYAFFILFLVVKCKPEEGLEGKLAFFF